MPVGALYTTELAENPSVPYQPFFDTYSRSASPYINHFISPDTIVPSPSNSQSWNRYSYVSNNPLRYTDPTGHMQASDDYQDSDGKCAKGDKGCNDLVAKIVKKRKPFVPQLTDNGYFESWEGEQNIDPDAWQDMLSEIRDDVHSTWRMFLPIEALWYDTPFYNDHGKLSGTGCLGVKCYDRSELNYAAQGELWAAVGVSNTSGHGIVKFWKESKCLWTCERNDLREEYEMFDVGYQDYQELYPPRPSTP